MTDEWLQRGPNLTTWVHAAAERVRLGSAHGRVESMPLWRWAVDWRAQDMGVPRVRSQGRHRLHGPKSSGSAAMNFY